MTDRLPLSILVVDDNADAADSLATFLTLNGYPVRTAYSGSVALRLAAEAPPDVVVLDLMMPEMNGWAVAEQLATARPRPVIVAVTGHAADANRTRSVWANIPFHFVKPVNPKVILDLLTWAERTRGDRQRMGPSV
ncbi:response regulator [Limnoglobus roseus]|uniref:Response regulator n=1 Tax=Limnoglobus roseus TaxID=2598579 RepID=A0A5C1AL20_9BACT|nr:response regulator [Limnoglobus roseus]QEL19640.1 response regulator [Limnoglobus roseus]